MMLLFVGVLLVACDDRSEPTPPPADVPVWPELPVRGFITDRPATDADVSAGDAAFSFLAVPTPGTPPTPLDLTIPQYAIHTDPETGKVTRAILIQAEEFAVEKVLGLRPINGDPDLIKPLHEVELLGTDRPADDR